jgi:hypothetical protein
VSTQPEGVPAPSGDAAEASTPDVTIRGVVTGASVSYDPATGLPTEHVQITIDPVAVNANIREQMRRSEVVRALRRPAGPNPLPDTEIGLANGSVMRAAADVPAADRIRGTAANAVIVDYVDDSHTGLTLAQTQAVQDSFTNPQLGTPHAAASERLLDSLADPADTGNAAAMAAINAYQRDRMQHGRAVRAAVARVLSNVDVPQLARTLEPDAMADVAGYVALGMSGDVAAAADVAAVRERMRQYMMRQDPAEFARQYSNRPAVGVSSAVTVDYAGLERAVTASQQRNAAESAPSMNERIRAALAAEARPEWQRSMADRLEEMTPQRRQMFLFGLAYGRRPDADLVESEIPAQAAADVPQRADTQQRSIAVNHNRRAPRRRPQPAADATPAAPQPPVVHIRQRPRRPGQVPQLVLTLDEPEAPEAPEAPVVPYDVPQVPVDWQPPRALLPALLEQLWAVAAGFDTGAAALGITFNPVGAYQVFGLWCTDAVNRWLSAPSHSDYTYGVEFVRQEFRNSARGGPEIQERCAPVAQLLAMYPLFCAGRPEGDRTRDYALYASAAVVARILIVETQAVLVVAPNPGGIPHRAVDWDATDAEAASNASTGLVASWATDVDAVHGVPCSMATHWVHRAAGLEPDVEARIVRHMQAVPRVTRPYIVPGIDNRLATLLIEIPAQAVARRSLPYRLFCGSDGHPIACGRPAQPSTEGQAVPPSAYQPSATTLAGLAEELRISHSSVRRRAWSSFQTLGLGPATAPVQPPAPAPAVNIGRRDDESMYATSRVAVGGAAVPSVPAPRQASVREAVPEMLRYFCDQARDLAYGATAIWWGLTDSSWHCRYLTADDALTAVLAGGAHQLNGLDGLDAAARAVVAALPQSRVPETPRASEYDSYLTALGRQPLLHATTLAADPDADQALLFCRGTRVAWLLRAGSHIVLLCGHTDTPGPDVEIAWGRVVPSDSAEWSYDVADLTFGSTIDPGVTRQEHTAADVSRLMDYLRASPAPPATNIRPVPDIDPPLFELPAQYLRNGRRLGLFATEHGVLVAAASSESDVWLLTAAEAARVTEQLRCMWAPARALASDRAGRRHPVDITGEPIPVPADRWVAWDSAAVDRAWRTAFHHDTPAPVTGVGDVLTRSPAAPLPSAVDNSRAAVPLWLDFLAAHCTAPGSAVAAWWSPTGAWSCGWLPAGAALQRVLSGACDNGDRQHVWQALCNIDARSQRTLAHSGAVGLVNCLNALGHHPLLGVALTADSTGASVNLPLYRNGRNVARVVLCGNAAVLLCGTDASDADNRPLDWAACDASPRAFSTDNVRASWVAAAWRHNVNVADLDIAASTTALHGWQTQFQALDHAAVLTAYIRANPTGSDTPRSVPNTTPPLTELPAVYYSSATPDAHRVLAAPDGTPVFAIRLMAHESGSFCSLTLRQSAEVAEALRIHSHARRRSSPPAAARTYPPAEAAALRDEVAVDNAGENEDAGVLSGAVVSTENRTAVPMLLRFLCGHAPEGGALVAWWGLTGEWCYQTLPASGVLDTLLDNERSCDPTTLREIAVRLQMLQGRPSNELSGSFTHTVRRCLDVLGRHPLLAVAVHGYYNDRLQIPQFAVDHGDVDVNSYPLYRVGRRVARIVRCGATAVLLCAERTTLAPDRPLAWDAHDTNRAEEAGEYGAATWTATARFGPWGVPAAVGGPGHQRARQIPVSRILEYLAANPAPADLFNRPVAGTTPQLIELPARILAGSPLAPHRLFATYDGTPVCVTPLNPTPNPHEVNYLSAAESARAAEQLRTTMRRAVAPPAPAGVAAARTAAMTGMISIDEALAANPNLGDLSYLPAPRTNAAQPAPPTIDLDGSFRARAYALGWRPSAAVQNEAEATAEAGAWVASHMRIDPLLSVPVTRAPAADAPFSGVIQNSWGVPLVPTGHIHTYRSAAAGALPPPSPDGWLDPAQRIDDAAEAARQLIAPVPVQLTAHQLGITTGQLTYAAGGLISNPGYMYAPRAVSRPQIPDAPVVDDNNSNVGQPLLITELARTALPRLFDLVWASAVQSGNAHAVLWYGPTGRYGLKYFPESANLRWVTSADREHYQARRNLYDAEVGTWSTEAQRLELDHCLTVLAAYPLWNMVSGRISDRCVLVRDDYAVRLVASSDDLGSGYVIIVGPAELASPPRPINWERAQNRWGLAESYTAGWNGAPPVPSEYDVPHPDMLSTHISRSHRTQNIVDLALYLRDVPTTPTRVLNTSGLFTGYVSGSLSELPASLITRRDPAERWRLFSDRAGLPTFAGRIVNDRPVIDDLTPSAARHLGEMLRVTNPNVYQHLYGNVVTLLGQPS